MSGATIDCACPKCGKQFHLKAELEGKKVVCKACGNKFVVAAQKPPQAQAAPAQPAGQKTEAKAAAEQSEQANSTTSTATETRPADQLDAPIPIDDSPLPVEAEAAETQQMIITSKGQADSEEEVKVETSGPYYVAKIFLTGKMVHVKIEEELNKYAALGWRVCQMLQIKDEAYVVFEHPDRWNEIEKKGS